MICAGENAVSTETQIKILDVRALAQYKVRQWFYIISELQVPSLRRGWLMKGRRQAYGRPTSSQLFFHSLAWSSES